MQLSEHLFFGQIGRQLICSDSSAQRMRNPNSRGKYLQLQFTVEDKGSSSRQQSITVRLLITNAATLQARRPAIERFMAA